MEKILTPVIGLEIHIQLKTKSKMFCSCNNDGENQPSNTTVCPVCMGHPGTLPVANKEAVAWATKMSLALNCTIPEVTKFDRKNYFYPDLPKGYQISQFDQPIGPNGSLTIDTVNGKKTVRITRLHLEEDAAKNVHSGDGKSTLVDYNRGGTPLMEVVTEPDMRTAQEAKTFVQELRLIARYLGVSDADMEKGHLRCDANVSLTDQPADAIEISKLHPKTEVKNINSFKAVERAIEYEIKRQTKLWEEGTPPDFSSTRGWNEDKGISEAQRTKEASHDYRYFPEPDIPPLRLGKGQEIDPEHIRATIGELPQARRERFTTEYGLTMENARVLVDDKKLADFFEQAMSELRSWLLSSGEPEGTADEMWEQHKGKLSKTAANWLINKLLAIASKEHKNIISDRAVTAENFAEFITLVHQNKLNSTIAQRVLEIMVQTSGDPSSIVAEHNLNAAPAEDLGTVIARILEANPKEVEQYKAGKVVLLQFFVGQVMRVTKGQTNPEEAAEMLREKLS